MIKQITIFQAISDDCESDCPKCEEGKIGYYVTVDRAGTIVSESKICCDECGFNP